MSQRVWTATRSWKLVLASHLEGSRGGTEYTRAFQDGQARREIEICPCLIRDTLGHLNVTKVVGHKALWSAPA